MDRADLTLYIQLINTDGIGPIGFKKLLARFGCVEEALSAVSKKKKIFPQKKAEEEIMRAELCCAEIITLEDELYPYNLKQIEDCPPVLYAKGNTEFLKNSNMLAVVGSRNASLSAVKLAENISSRVAKSDIVIVSGMARGIDAAAHRGALAATGKTVAVLGTGVDVVYPPENENLYQELLKKGLVISEYPFGTKPQASNFPRRNRIVSGLSKGVLVIEAGLKSGSLITAGQALEQGRDVYAIPGAPYDGRASGCNKLLKEGAVLVDSAEDILENFNFSPVAFVPQKKHEPETADLFEDSLDNAKNNYDISEQNDEYAKLLSLISESGEDVDELIRALDFPPERVLTMIVELELDDRLMRLPGNKVAKV